MNAKSTGCTQEPKAKVDFVRNHVTEPTQALKKVIWTGVLWITSLACMAPIGSGPLVFIDNVIDEWDVAG